MGPELGFEIEEIPEQDINTMAVSSTKIRKAIATGDIKTANLYLGYPYSLEGTVIKGDQIGRTIGFPTANILLGDPNKLIPGSGIYAAWTYVLDKRYPSMLYIGTRPVLHKQSLVIEVNILDFSEDIYGKPIRVELLEFIRGDAKLNGLEELIQQINLDKIKIQEFFKKITFLTP
jgi:riboflavin kinase/FMN adenylyltransferase